MIIFIGRCRLVSCISPTKYKFTQMIKKRIVLVTGNSNKLLEFRQILSDRYEIDAQDVDLPEMQGDPYDISKEKAMMAYKQINEACITEDTSLCFNAMNGMPGPYIKWFLQAIGPEGIGKMLDGFEDKTGYAQTIISYMGPELKEPISFIGQTKVQHIIPYTNTNREPLQLQEGLLISVGRQLFKILRDPCFLPDGYDQTYAEMDKSLKNTLSHRLRAIDKMVLHFQK